MVGLHVAITEGFSIYLGIDVLFFEVVDVVKEIFVYVFVVL